MSKPWKYLKSKTIRSGLRLFLVSVAGPLVNSNPNLQKIPEVLTAINSFLGIESIRALSDNIQGRINAKTQFDNNPTPEPLPQSLQLSSSVVAAVEPDFTEVSKLSTATPIINEPVDLEKPHAIALHNTWLKAQPLPSDALKDSEKFWVVKGAQYAAVLIDPKEIHKHVQLEFSKPFPWGKQAFAYVGLEDRSDAHWELKGNPPNNAPKDEPFSKKLLPAQPRDRGKALTFPGFTGTYYTNDAIITNGNFTWGEATHGGARIPVNSDVVYGMIRIAKALEEIRTMLGNHPMQINSWYRDPATNAAVGGASMSRHLTGDAVDFVLMGDRMHPYDVFDALDAWWGSRGGLASSTVFTHIDARGYRARWDYGY